MTDAPLALPGPIAPPPLPPGLVAELLAALPSGSLLPKGREREGRPTRLTSTLVRGILESVVCGANYVTAAHKAGVRESTFYEWLRKPEEPYLTFARLLRQTEAILKEKLTAAILNKAVQKPELALEFLARRWPAEWARAEVAPAGAGGPLVNIDLGKILDRLDERARQVRDPREALPEPAGPAALPPAPARQPYRDPRE